jgi:hypothetical protein
MDKLLVKCLDLGVTEEMLEHPMFPVLVAALNQAMHGKGKRHGGNDTPWLKQPIFHYANMHGRGFLTGQAAKKLEEAASTRSGTPFITEVLGAIVYSCAAVIHEEQRADTAELGNLQLQEGFPHNPLSSFPSIFSPKSTP